MKNTEEVTEEMSRLVISLCDKYRRIYTEELKAKAELHDYAKSSAEAVYPKEKEMYEKLSADASKSFAGTHKLMGILYSCYKDKLKSRYAALRKNVLSEANVQMTVANFLVDIPKGLLDQEVVLWPKIPGTNTNNMSQILNWYRLRCIAMDAEMNAL